MGRPSRRKSSRGTARNQATPPTRAIEEPPAADDATAASTPLPESGPGFPIVDLQSTVEELQAANVARHAGTADAYVRIRCQEHRAEIEVEDRGVGFDPRAATRGFGLDSTCDRIEHMGGSVRIESSPGAGTRIRACAPAGGAPERGGARASVCCSSTTTS